MKHLWLGSRIDDSELDTRLKQLPKGLADSLSVELSCREVIATCQDFSTRLLKGEFKELSSFLGGDVSEIAKFCSRESLEKKVIKELGSLEPSSLEVVNKSKNLFESWNPLGVLAHVTPGNSPGLAFLAVVEGLLAGNTNILKLSSRDNDFALTALENLCACDETGQLAKKIIALRISSQKKEILTELFASCDGVSAWGGDPAINSIRSMLPAQVRFIPWGHKISLSYIAKSHLRNKEKLKDLAGEIVSIEQQACSSPQCVYVETDSFGDLTIVAEKLAPFIEEESKKAGAPDLDIQSQAEITNITELTKLEAVWGKAEVIEGADKNWRLLIEMDPRLKASPLYRTVWLKPLLKQDIVKTLVPVRGYLQTASLLAEGAEAGLLSMELLKAGVTRVTLPGKMLESYEGESHDGEYALSRYMKRVRAEVLGLEGFSRLDELKTEVIDRSPMGEIMDKPVFQSQKADLNNTDLYFRSGGSSGNPALSLFSYRDYHQQMKAAAFGLRAAGLDPMSDRCMNLFFGGGLYGGFLSFFTILENLEAVQFPMAAHDDFDYVIDTIIDQKVNTILGMPSYLVSLFQSNPEKLKKAQVIKKIFYGGEHFSTSQRDWFKNEFGVELIRSASYGSVDAGPLGFQCPYSEGGVHHLNSGLHQLEILQLGSHSPVEGEEIGRLVFTTKDRQAVKVNRYDIGDLGRWVKEKCPCGRGELRFELMGRHGDIFRAGGTFINYNKIHSVLQNDCDYAGELQVEISKEKMKDQITLFLDSTFSGDEKSYREKLLEAYAELNEVVVKEDNLNVIIKMIEGQKFKRTPGSGKLIRVIDQRELS